jgi:ABC-type multidrug transport system fused ATPase/permease subunit
VSEAIHEEEALGKVYDSRLVRLLWRYVSPYRWQVVLTLLMVVPILLAELAPAFVVKTALDAVIAPDGDPVAPGRALALDPDAGVVASAVAATVAALRTGVGSARDALLSPPLGLPTIVWLALAYLVIAGLAAGLQFAHSVLMSTTGQLAMRDLRRAIFDRIQSLHLGFFDRYPVGRLVTRATNDVENVAEMFSAGVVALVTDLLKMVVLAAVLFAVSPKLAGVAFLVIPVLAVAAILFRLKVREAFRDVRVRIARINAHIQETITGMKVVQLFTRELRNLREFDEMNAGHRDAWRRSIRYDALLFSSVEMASGITFAVIIWYGTGLVEAGTLYLFMDYMRRFFMPLRDLSAKYSVMQSSMASSERIFQLLDVDVDVRDPEEPRALPDPGRGRGEITFENVWFRYAGGDWVIRDLSFRVAPGERVAFVGATGAGKTTIIKLLSRFYDVTKGRILLDGVDIRDVPQAELRRRVATVLQDVFLFSGTVADNIALGRDDLGREDVERVARAVEAHRFIQRLPRGYDTAVRERGTNFSAGQRQLLSFARALAHGADVLVLDEATSSIDTETEAMIQRGIHVLMEGKTAVAIAHRLSTIRDVDRIYVMHRGRLVEAGGHEELLARGGAYHRLYHLQAELEEGVGAAAAGS